MDMKRVKPAPGIVLLMPERDMKPLPADGEIVPLDQYWLARLRDGDAVPADEQSSPAAKPAKLKKEPS